MFERLCVISIMERKGLGMRFESGRPKRKGGNGRVQDELPERNLGLGLSFQKATQSGLPNPDLKGFRCSAYLEISALQDPQIRGLMWSDRWIYNSMSLPLSFIILSTYIKSHKLIFPKQLSIIPTSQLDTLLLFN